jgi:glycosyltransferase involved in cell wall biosynthesis
MSTLGIFTVKKICAHGGRYYTYGGFGEYLAAMRAEFDKTILVAHVKSHSPPEGHYEIEAGPDLTVVHLPQVRSEIGTWLYMPLVIWRSWCATTRMDVVHARMPNYTGVIGAWICRLKGIPVFIQVIADWHIEAAKMPVTRKYGLGLLMKLNLYFYDLLERWVCRKQMVFAQGHTCYEKHRHSADCELVLSSAHHDADITPPAERFGGKTRTILNVARLNAVKNQRLIVLALKELRAQGEDWRVVFVGEGPQHKSLASLAADCGVSDAVVFAGQADRGDSLWTHFDSADCFVLSSRSEGTPKVLLEAMARGLPVVASNVGGVPTAVQHEVRGLLFNDNDVADLCCQVRRLCAEPGLRKSLSTNAHEFSKLHTVETSTRLMLDKVFTRWPSIRPASTQPKEA